MVVGRWGRHRRNHTPNSPPLDHSPFRGLDDLMRGVGLHRMDHAALVSLVLSVIHEDRTGVGQMAGTGAAHADFCPDYHTCRLDWAHCWKRPPLTEKIPIHELLLANRAPQAFPGRPLLTDSRKGLRDNPPLLRKSIEGQLPPMGAQGQFLVPFSLCLSTHQKKYKLFYGNPRFSPSFLDTRTGFLAVSMGAGRHVSMHRPVVSSSQAGTGNMTAQSCDGGKMRMM